MVYRLVIFLLINFAALAIGGLSTGSGVTSEWYQGLNKAPWTPPGWVFGAAWTTIMICFSFYMAYLWKEEINIRYIAGLFLIQWILNVLWNPIFFHYHQVLAALIVISALTLLVAYGLFSGFSVMKTKSLLILPYFLWLLIATSLNAYILFKN